MNPPLSNVQLELLKLYATGVTDETLLELKKTLAKFFLDRMQKFLKPPRLKGYL